MIAELVQSNRSCRRFDEHHAVSSQTLLELIDLGRLSASAANLQPLKYIYACSPGINERIFSCLKWAGYLDTWPGPAEGERPGAYIVILQDTQISQRVDCDHGIAAQSILLGAREKGLAGCMIAAVNRPGLSTALEIDDHYKILLVLAIGKPREHAIIEPVDKDQDIRYWRDGNGNHHVPKRSMEEIIVARYES
jgi:nitroreductase